MFPLLPIVDGGSGGQLRAIPISGSGVAAPYALMLSLLAAAVVMSACS